MTTPAPDISSLLDQLRKQLLEVVKERNQLRAERSRLREALESISGYCQRCPLKLLSTGTVTRRIQSMADAALTDQKERSE